MKLMTVFFVLAAGLLLATPSLALQSSPAFQLESDSDSDSDLKQPDNAESRSSLSEEDGERHASSEEMLGLDSIQFESDSDSDSDWKQPDNAESWSSFSEKDGERHASNEEMLGLDSIVRRHRRDMDATNRDSFAGHTTVGSRSRETTDDQYRQVLRQRRWAIGSDDRVPVGSGELTGLPASAVGLLEGDDGLCTAFLVGPYHAVTAGHCVYDFPKKRWRRNLKFWPGRSCDLYNGSSLIWLESIAKTGYLTHRKNSADFGYVLFKKPATKLEWLPFGYWYPKPRNELSIYGYPDDKRCSRGGVDRRPMYHTTCPHATSKVLKRGRRLKYKCDTGRGMSGSPILSASSSGRLTAYCVHTHGGKRNRYNYGAMINFHRFWELVEWIRRTGHNLETSRPKGKAPVYPKTG